MRPGPIRLAMPPDIALAASAREWPDRIHRHLLDHGGARVVARVMGVDQATETGFDVLLIDDICSFLTPRLVSLVRERGAGVLGVFDPGDGPDAKRRLLDCGISDVIESGAGPDEFLSAVRSAFKSQAGSPNVRLAKSAAWSIAALGVTAGVGATEVAVAISRSLSTRLKTVLLDLDPVWPSIAARLDLPLHPNLRTAVDRALHDDQPISGSFHQIGELSVVGGLADRGAAGPVSHSEISMLLGTVAPLTEVVVADLGSMTNAFRSLFPWFDSLLLVASGDPVGLSRLAASLDQVSALHRDGKLVVVVNKTHGTRFHESEVRAEVSGAWPDLPLVVMPYDRRVPEAVWEGVVSDRGAFARATIRMTELIDRSVRQ